ncbi:MAG TPA: PEP-CTERM sorting domain-containing protein [Verrucomicrobiae bacterium]|nr:PEP-CTERM sorting domain-containing protein [Verrucomicrobiae bacterium]
MKSIKYIVAALAVAALATASYATITVNYGSSESTYLADSQGNYLDAGTTFEIGTFASAPTVGSPSLAGFTAFGTDTIVDGAIAGGITASDSGFAHNQIYIVVLNGSQEFIGYVSDADATNWKFPATADFPNSTSLDLGDMAAGGGGTMNLATGATVVYGQIGVDPSGPYTLLETVPEPSSIALVVMGLFGAFGLIRRRK